jgi:ATP synthase protein I
MGNDPHDKLDDLTARIRKAEEKPFDKSLDTAEQIKTSRAAFSFVGAVSGCVIIGWLIDHYLDTGPWGLLGMLFVGFASGLFSVWKSLEGDKGK